jgi:hypothetical protein
MTPQVLRVAIALAVLSLGLAPAQAQAKLGGTGAPQSESCKAAGGTESGNMCILPNGTGCQSMPLARDNECLDEFGNLVEDGEDYGSNMGPDDSNEESEGSSSD